MTTADQAKEVETTKALRTRTGLFIKDVVNRCGGSYTSLLVLVIFHQSIRGTHLKS
jgi:hypothetical protein